MATTTLILALAHNGANHAAYSETIVEHGFAVAACRRTLTVSVEHGPNGVPLRADEHDLSCRSCVRIVRKRDLSHTTDD